MTAVLTALKLHHRCRPKTTNQTPTSKVIADALPQLINFGAYPASIYLGRDGKVRSVHADFASPATGGEHTRLKKELHALTEHLLAESAQSSAQPLR